MAPGSASGNDMEKMELQAFGLRAMLDTAIEELGAGEVQEILDGFGVRLESLRKPGTWMSMKFAEGFMGEMVRRSGDPLIINRFARACASAKYLGLLYPLLRAFGTPEAVLRHVVKFSPRLNKAGSYKLSDVTPGFARIEYEPAPQVVDTGKWFCRSLHVQFEYVPTLCGLPPGHADHPKCITRGDAACVYELRWQTPPRSRVRWYALVLGLAVGALIALLLTADTYARVSTPLLCALLGWASGYAFELSRSIGRRTEDLIDHQHALEQSLRENEDRFEELLAAKTAVDQQVEVRTQELRATTEKLAASLAQVQALDRAKTDFFNNVSHELRSPLTLILAPLEDLAAGRSLPGGERTAFEAMRRNAARLLRLINQLLDLAKIDAGQMEIRLAACDLPAMVRGILDGFEAAAQKQGIILQCEVPAGPLELALDVSWIESAITNLVANAMRFTKPDGAIRVSVEDHGGEVWIAVSDDGPGIAKADQAKIFARFAQGDSSKKVVGGTGIGLALVREAARLHQGDVSLNSELGHGSTFIIKLPRRGEVSATAVVSGRPKPRASLLVPADLVKDVPASRAGPTPHAPLVLLVEDNPELREFMANVLSVRYRVRSAIDGKQGLALASELKPDVVVSDVAMPEMNGYELCRALRAQHETRDVPVLLVTARSEVASVLEGFDAGASDYLVKPFHGRELLARVDVHARLRRVIQELVLRERHAALGVLAASVAHQIRNPLTTLVSGLPAMRARMREKVDPSTRDLIEVMLDCAGRIERTTTDLLTLSRVDREAGGRYRPSEGLGTAIRMLRARAPRQVTIEDEVEPSFEIAGHPGEMSHVFLNVLDNALRAIDQHGTISVKAANQGGFYEVRIGDSGPGVSEELASRIFEPFFTTRRAGEGTGLGLAIVRQVLQRCGGDIRVSRSPLGGAEFTVRIPAVMPEASSLRVGRDTASGK